MVGILVISLLIFNLAFFKVKLDDATSNKINDTNFKHFVIFNHVLICILLSVGACILFLRFAQSNLDNKILNSFIPLKPKKWFQLMIAFILIAFVLYKLIHFHSNLNNPMNTSIEDSFKLFLFIQHWFMVLFILFAVIQLISIIAYGHMISPKNYMEGTSRKYWKTVPNTDGYYYFWNKKTNQTQWNKPESANF